MTACLGLGLTSWCALVAFPRHALWLTSRMGCAGVPEAHRNGVWFLRVQGELPP